MNQKYKILFKKLILKDYNKQLLLFQMKIMNMPEI